MPDELPVRLYGTHLGELGRSAGRALFRWSADAEARWPLNSTALSESLRVGVVAIEATESFFGALLPEGQWLENLARQVQVSSSDLVGILDRVGADLAGALSIGRERDAAEPEALTPERLEQLILTASGFVLGGGGSALPGFQRKLTLTRRGGHWVAGNGTVASTHILKPVPADARATAEQEHYVLELARRLGLNDFETWVEQIGSRAVLVVERYDRLRSGDRVERIHQEDLAQALGLPWGGDEKFQRNDPRASLAAVAAVLDRHRTAFTTGPGDREKLLRYTVLNVAAGNTDAHAKNFSILRPVDARPRLAPFYDAAPLALAYDANTALSMSIAGEWQLPEVTVDHLVDEATGWGIPAGDARRAVEEVLAGIVEGTRVLDAHPSISSHVPGYIRGQAQNLLRGDPARIRSAVPLMLLPRLD